MFEEDNLSFSDSIEIVPTVEERRENEKKENIPQNQVVEVKEDRKQDRNQDNKKENKNFQVKEFSKPSARQQSLYNITSNIYIEKYTEYCGIPDFIVNQLFDIDDGKGTISIEEAIIMLINLFPNTREKINSAKIIEDAIKIGKSEIINFLYKECKYGFINIPLHSRENLSKKITSDFESGNFEASLYDYQLMRLSGYIKQ